jgi:hypothetical protein
MARILYTCPDNPSPSGGVRVLYRHVEILKKAGFDAWVVHDQQGFRPTWFRSDVPLLYAQGGLALDPADWVVIPEAHSAALEGLRDVGCRKAVFCQGHFLVFNTLTPQGAWSDYGVSEVLVTSIAIRDFVKRIFRVDPVLIPLSLELSEFRPGNGPAHAQVACMPRKGSHHLRMIQGMLHHMAPELRDVPWAAIEGLPEQEVAAVLRDSAFFLCTGYREGFGLPPLEAMACGAMPVGFRAGGGAEYATSENGFWVGDEDTIALADKLIELLRAYRHDPTDPRWRRTRQAGFATAARYTRAAEAQRLIEFWSARARSA